MESLIFSSAEKIKAFFAKHKYAFLLFYTAVLTGYVVFSYFFRPVVVSGSSMLPTLYNNETVYIKRITDKSEIKRGDIVVFYSPVNPGELLIKRVIAIPGDKVAIVDGKVYLNGNLLFEPYVNSVKSHETIPLTEVPADSYFVLGDNRVVSSDSREFGFVGFESIYGKLIFKPEE